jgi:hypothetical protein
VAVAVASLVLAGGALGWLLQRSYFSGRYADSAPLPFATAPPDEVRLLYEWVPTVSDSHIGVAGFGWEYRLFGEDLSNTVEYVGRRGAHGAFFDAATCREWRDLLNRGEYDYVVISADSATDAVPPQTGWTRGDPAASEVARAGTASVFRVATLFDVEGC